jgi:hypothetical protein
MITAEVSIQGELLDIPALEKAIISSMDAVLAETFKDFKATAATWSSRSRVDFKVEKATRKGNTIEGSVWTDNPNYCRVNFGTGPRPRTAKTARGMSFRYSYRAKTRPGHVGSGSSSRSGRWVAGIRHVISGPITPRKFDETIMRSRRPDFIKGVNSAIAQATK